MYKARVGCPRPDTIDKAQLLNFLQAQKWRSADQFLFAGAKWDQIIQTVTHGAHRLLIWQQRQASSIGPILPHAGLHNAFSISLVACGLTFRAGAFGTFFLYAHKEILAEAQRGCPGDKGYQ